jgi:hypothetical protein
MPARNQNAQIEFTTEPPRKQGRQSSIIRKNEVAAYFIRFWLSIMSSGFKLFAFSVTPCLRGKSER